MKLRNKWCAAILFLYMVLPLSACNDKVTVSNAQIVFTTGLNEQQLFRIGGEVCSAAEAKLLLAVTKNSYEESFGPEIWQQTVAGTTMEGYVKNMVKNQLAQLKCMVLYAKQEGISLTDEENSEILKAAQIYYKSLTKREMEVLGLEQEHIEGMYKEYALAQKVYAKKTKDVDEEISDAEAKVIVVQHIFRNTKDMIQAEKTAVRKEMQQYLVSLQDGADFFSLANEASDDSQTEYAFGRGEMEESFETAAFALQKGEVSGLIETSSGYHILKCINDYDIELTERNKKKILEKRRQEMFELGYSQFVTTLLFELNETAWEKISFADFADVRTDSLYEVYAEVVGNP